MIPQRIGNRSTIVLAAVLILLISIIGVNIVQRRGGILGNFDTQRIYTVRQSISSGGLGSGSGVNLGYDTSTVSGFVQQVLVGGVYLLLAPFPWQLGGASMRVLLTLPESLIWWCLFLGGTIPGSWYILRNRLTECLPFFIFLCGMILPYSFMFANVGLAFRQRGQLMPYLIIIGMVGFEQYVFKHKEAKTKTPLSNQRHSRLTPSW